MNFTVSRRDIIVLVTFLVIAGGTIGWARFDVMSKRAKLEPEAEMLRTKLYEGVDPATFEQITEVTSDKSYAFFGKDWGVVRLYSRAKDDATMDSFTGVEYFYEWTDGRWQQTDTASIKLPEHIYDGYDKFRAKGYRVNDDAYLRFSR